MKINEETTVSEEQVLFNKLRYEDQELIINIMKTLQPCELSFEVEEEKKIPEKLDLYEDLQDILNSADESDILNSADESVVLNAIHKCLTCEKIKINEIIDYLKSKGE